jgi:uncharacterized protein (TIGR03086 family)
VDAETLHRRTVECWVDRVGGVSSEAWELPTPCIDWSVRELVNHVVGEDRWTVPLMAGATLAEVGSAFDGDLLGDEPAADAAEAATAALAAVNDGLATRSTVHLSYGEEAAAQYVHQLAADHLVHAWDLAVATGSDPTLPPELVSEVGRWFADHRAAYRAAGLVAHPYPGPAGSQDALIGAFGRRPGWGADDAAATGFARAFGAGDVDAIMALMTEDCVFESTDPAPDGVRIEGAAAVRQVWDDLFTRTPGAAFTTEELYAGDGRAVLRWRFSWTGADGRPGHVRGVDTLKLRDGKVCEKLSYVKG